MQQALADDDDGVAHVLMCGHLNRIEEQDTPGQLA